MVLLQQQLELVYLALLSHSVALRSFWANSTVTPIYIHAWEEKEASLDSHQCTCSLYTYKKKKRIISHSLKTAKDYYMIKIVMPVKWTILTRKILHTKECICTIAYKRSLQILCGNWKEGPLFVCCLTYCHIQNYTTCRLSVIWPVHNWQLQAKIFSYTKNS